MHLPLFWAALLLNVYLPTLMGTSTEQPKYDQAADVHNQQERLGCLLQRTSKVYEPAVLEHDSISVFKHTTRRSNQIVSPEGVLSTPENNLAVLGEMPFLVGSLNPPQLGTDVGRRSGRHYIPKNAAHHYNLTIEYKSGLDTYENPDDAKYFTTFHSQRGSYKNIMLAVLASAPTKSIGILGLIGLVGSVLGILLMVYVIWMMLHSGGTSNWMSQRAIVLQYPSPRPRRLPSHHHEQDLGIHTPRAVDNMKHHDRPSSGVLDTVLSDQRAQSKSQRAAGFSRHCLNVANQGGIDEFYDVQGQELGRGTFGSVHEARNKASGAVRAVKTISKSSLSETSMLAQEIEIIHALDHPNIVRLYEVFEDVRCIYLVMEACHGGELFDAILKAESGFSEKSAARLIKQMVGAVFYVHSMGIAHRDLKPENFLLAEDVDIADCALKLVDFGSARRTTPGTPMTTCTYTPYYVAPEVLKGSYSLPCDIWSLGVLLYVLLCGRPPFAGDSDDEILRTVRKGHYSFRKPVWLVVSDDAKDLIQKMLVSDVDQRYTAEQVLHHPWVDKLAPKASNTALSEMAFANLRSFHAQSTFQKAALTAMAKHLGDSAIQDLKEMFYALDADGNGTITIDELRDGMEKMGMDIPQDLIRIMSEVDSDGSGEIDYSEFLAATLDRRHFLCEDACWAAFRTFDLDGNGQITKEELMQVLSGGASENLEEMLGMHREEIEQIILEADVDGDGEIDFEEFVLMMGGAKASPAGSRSGRSIRKSLTSALSDESEARAETPEDFRIPDEASVDDTRDDNRAVRFSDPEITQLISPTNSLPNLQPNH